MANLLKTCNKNVSSGDLAKMPQFPPLQVDSPSYVDSLFSIYIISVLSAFNAEMVTYPLDLVKTRLQIQGERAAKGDAKLATTPHRGMFKTAIGIATEEGITRLWKGVHAAFARHMVYSGIRIVAYRQMKEKLFDPGQKHFPLWQSALCGVTAGAVGQYLASPADLLKVQLMMEGRRRLMGLPPRVHGLYDAFQKTWARGGLRGLWKGSVPNVQRAALVNLGDLSTYDVAKQFILKHTNLPDSYTVHVLASTCAGFVAAVLGTPADVIKSRVMNQPTDEKGRGLLYSSSTDCLKQAIKLEGLSALYKGFLPNWMRLAPWALTFWMTYEQISKLIGGKSF